MRQWHGIDAVKHLNPPALPRKQTLYRALYTIRNTHTHHIMHVYPTCACCYMVYRRCNITVAAVAAMRSLPHIRVHQFKPYMPNSISIIELICTRRCDRHCCLLSNTASFTRLHYTHKHTHIYGICARFTIECHWCSTASCFDRSAPPLLSITFSLFLPISLSVSVCLCRSHSDRTCSFWQYAWLNLARYRSGQCT